MADSPKRIKITVEKFLTMWNALVALAQKTLPSPETEMRAALCCTAYQATYDATQAANKKIDAVHIRKAGAKVQILDPLGLRSKRDRLNATQLTIKLPAKLFTKGDLPQVSDDEGDLKNRSSTAAIAAMLGPLYDYEAKGDDKELLAETVEGLDQFDAIADEAPASGDPVDGTAADLSAERPALTLADGGKAAPAAAPADNGGGTEEGR